MALLALDERRIAARRLDVAPCLRLPASAFGPADPEQTMAGAPPPSAPAAADTAAAESAPDDVAGEAGPEAHAASATAERPGDEDAEADGADAGGQAGGMSTSARLDGVQSLDPNPNPGPATSGGASGVPAGMHGMSGERWAGAPGPGDEGGDLARRAGPAQAWGLSRALQAFVAERYAPWLLRPSVQARPQALLCWVRRVVRALRLPEKGETRLS